MIKKIYLFFLEETTKEKDFLKNAVKLFASH